jgi:hypothetical protein
VLNFIELANGTCSDEEAAFAAAATSLSILDAISSYVSPSSLSLNACKF